MTFIGEKEAFLLDLRGYVIFKHFLPQATIDLINQVIDGSPASTQSPKFAFVTLDPIFLDIIADKRILETCSKWMDPHFRFDHAWGVQQSDGSIPTISNLHAGPYGNQGFFQYHWHGGCPRASCLNFAIATEPQLPGDGGLVLVPGSHKSHLPFGGQEVFCNLLEYSLEDSDIVIQPNLEPGDLLVFAEALMHGSADWRPSGKRRRNLYFKYCLGSMGWLPQDNPDIQFLRAHARTEQERRLFRSAYVSASDGILTDIDWRQPTWVGIPQPKANRLVNILGRLPPKQRKWFLQLVQQIPETPRRQLLRLIRQLR